MSPALAGGFLTTEPPGKPLDDVLDVGRRFRESQRQHSYWTAGGPGSPTGYLSQGKVLRSVAFHFLSYPMMAVLLPQTFFPSPSLLRR